MCLATNRLHDHPTADRLLVALQGLLGIETLDMHAALSDASGIVAKALDADKVDVFFVDPAIDTLIARGTSPTPMGRKQHEIGMHMMAIANGGPEVGVFLTGEPYVTGHADEDPEALRGITVGLGVRSVLAVPLVINGERNGIFVACSARADAFDEGDLAFFSAAAHWVG